MKFLKVALALFFACLPSAFAQVLVEVRFDQTQFLAGEALPAIVRVTNRSGQTLHLGGEPDWLTFSIEARDGLIVNKNGEAPVVGAFTLENAKVATKRVDVQPYFEIARSGRYRLVATLKIKEWGAQTASPAKDFDIVEGSDLWTRDIGVPGGRAANQSPEIRRYTLLQATTLKSQIRLYFRLTEVAESRVLKVFQLGQMVSFARPEVELDGQSRVHILHQNGAHSGQYTVINPAGDIEVKQQYDFTESRPQLKISRDGVIKVVGGARRVTDEDLPADKSKE